MPLVRFRVRNEFGLGRPELYGNIAGEDEDPKALLDGVAVAGLVGILRQLGDLAEFAAEVFHGIQEQVTVTASRSQKLTSRVRRIESSLPPLEKGVLSQTSHIHFAYTAGCEWHPHIQNEQNHFIYNDLPLFVMESYERCRDPPRLHLLDKFGIGGPGSCLMRYSDPTFFKKESGNPMEGNDMKVRRDKSYRKRKKKRLSRRNRAISRAMSTSNETSGTCPSSLNDDGRTSSQTASTVGMACTSSMQEQSDMQEQPYVREQSDVQEQPHAREQPDVQEPSDTHDSRNGSGYIEYLINQSPVSKPEEKLSEGYVSSPTQHAGSKCSVLAEGCTEVVDDNILCSPSTAQLVPCASSDTQFKEEETLGLKAEQSIEDKEDSEIVDSNFGPGTPERETRSQRSFDRMDTLFDEVDPVDQIPCQSEPGKTDRGPESGSGEENQSERVSETEAGSEAEEFEDARNTIESESDNDLDGQPKQKLVHYLGDVNGHRPGDALSSNYNNGASADVPQRHMAQCPEHDHSADESCGLSYVPENGEASCVLPDSVPEEAVSDDKTFEEPGESVATYCQSSAEAVPHQTICTEEPVTRYPSSEEAVPHENISPEEPVATYPSLAEAVPHENGEASFVLPDPVPEEAVSDYKTTQEPGESVVSRCPPLSEAVSRQKISPEEPIATYPSLGEAVPDKSILPEEAVATYPSLAEDVPDENGESSCVLPPALEEALSNYRTFQEPGESVATCCRSLTEAVPRQKISPQEPGLTYPLLGEAVPDKKILREEPVAAYPLLAEAVPHEKISAEEPVAMCSSDGDHATDEPHTASDVSGYERTICGFPEPVSTESTHDEAIPQVPGYDLAVVDPHASSDVENDLKGECLAALCSPSISDNSVLDAKSSLSGSTLSSYPDSQEPFSNGPSLESVKIWSNGSLLGLEPSKPPVFAVPNSVIGDKETKNNGEANVLTTGKNEVSDRLVEDTDSFQSVPCTSNEKASLPLVTSDPNAQHSSILGQSNGSHQHNPATSFGVFSLSHRLLMNGFRRNSSACNIESVPARKDTEVAMEEKTELLDQSTQESTFNAPFGYESLFSSPPSSPPIEHMKISFNPIDSFAGCKLKLKIPCQPQYPGSNTDMFPSFQLVPESVSPYNNATDSDGDNDTFCRSSPCISVDHHIDCSASDSELWESDESPERKDEDLYDALCRASPVDSMPSFGQVGDRSAHDGISMEPSLSGSFLDLPCFDAVDPTLATETQYVSNCNPHKKLPSPTEPLSLAPLRSFEQEQVSEPDSCGSGEKRHTPPDSLEHTSDRKFSKSACFEEPRIATSGNGKQTSGEAAESVLQMKNLDTEKGPNPDIKGQDIDKEDLLQQMSTKQSSPRSNRIAFCPPTSVDSSAILEKANAICRAMATDDRDD